MSDCRTLLLEGDNDVSDRNGSLLTAEGGAIEKRQSEALSCFTFK